MTLPIDAISLDLLTISILQEMPIGSLAMMPLPQDIPDQLPEIGIYQVKSRCSEYFTCYDENDFT